MRRTIVEGDDYSVLPVPVVHLMRWLRKRFGRPEVPEAAHPDDVGEGEGTLD